MRQLTPREREVLSHVVAGRLNNRSRPRWEWWSDGKVHRARIMQKVGTTSVAELVRLTERLAALRG